MIENADFSPEELERRKKDKIEFQVKKRNSTIFVLCSTVIQIVETLVILAALLFADLMLMFKVFDLNKIEVGPTILQLSFFGLFFVGLILGFFAYKYTMYFIVTKFDLTSKLLDTTLEHYKTLKKKPKVSKAAKVLLAFFVTLCYIAEPAQTAGRKKEIKMNKIGIIGAMETEVKMLRSKLENPSQTEYAGLTFYEGTISGKNLIIVKSGVGKVNAALCAQALALKFGASKIINTGIAGATGGGLNMFDFVASTEALYHDVDVEIFGYKPGQIPGMPETFKADDNLAEAAVKAFANTEASKEHKILKGRIASGDQFISDSTAKNRIKTTFAPLCVEMEGAAIAHACTLNKVPFVIIRCMSDMADDSERGESKYKFNEDSAAEESAKLILELIKLI